MMEHLPALQVVIPLLAAPLCALVNKGRFAWLVALAASWAAFAVALQLIAQTADGTIIHYAMGDWMPPYGIEYRIDRLSAYMFALITGIGAVTILFAHTSICQQIVYFKQSTFYAVYLLCLAGLLGIVGTNDAFNLYVFLEISSLATYTLIAKGRDRRALDAAFQYLIIGTIGATFILIGIGLLYMMTGTLNMTDLATRIPALQDSRPVLAAFAFITVGVSMKAALFPLHMWLPNAYTHAPHFVTSFLAATATKVGVYILIRMMYTVFGHEFAFSVMPVGTIFVILAVPAILVGSLVALYQVSLKRMLAFSSIAQIGYMAMAIGLGTQAGLEAAITHLANHAVIKGALFLSIGCMAYSLYKVGIPRVHVHLINGLARKMPWTCMAFVLAGLALIGVPLSGGFISKWMLLTAVTDGPLWWLAVVIVVGSLLALIYIWRIVDRLYFAEPDPALAQVTEAPRLMLIPTWLLVIASWYVGIDTRHTVTIAEEAAAQLMPQQLVSKTQLATETLQSFPDRDRAVPLLIQEEGTP